MFAKLVAEEDHLVDLKKVFERLMKYNLKLNPTSVCLPTLGKLLGFDPDKVNAMTELPTPRTEK